MKSPEIERIAAMVRDGKLSPKDAVKLVESFTGPTVESSESEPQKQETERTIVDTPSGVHFEFGSTPPRSERVRASAEESAKNRVHDREPPSFSTSNQGNCGLNLDFSGFAQNFVAAGASITVAFVTYPIVGPGGTALALGTFHLLRKRG